MPRYFPKLTAHHSTTRSKLRFRTLVKELENRRVLASLIVDTLSDAFSHGAATSLRDAITQANFDAKNGQSDSITFASNLNGTVLLEQGTLEIGKSGGSGTISINGNSKITILLNTGGPQSVVSVQNGVTTSITGLTITGTSGGTSEVGLTNDGILTLDACHIDGNSGTGIVTYNRQSGHDLTLIGSTVSNNGNNGISNYGSVIIKASSQISGNNGSGIFVSASQPRNA
jgi:hypothetical protein